MLLLIRALPDGGPGKVPNGLSLSSVTFHRVELFPTVKGFGQSWLILAVSANFVLLSEDMTVRVVY
jgi:hypothetical protein